MGPSATRVAGRAPVRGTAALGRSIPREPSAALTGLHELSLQIVLASHQPTLPRLAPTISPIQGVQRIAPRLASATSHGPSSSANGSATTPAGLACSHLPARRAAGGQAGHCCHTRQAPTASAATNSSQITSQVQLKLSAPPISPCANRTKARVAPQAGQGTPVACSSGQLPPPEAIDVLKQSSAVSSGASSSASAPPPSQAAERRSALRDAPSAWLQALWTVVIAEPPNRVWC